MRPRALLVCVDPLPLTGGDAIYTYGIALRLAALYELDVLALSLDPGARPDPLRERLVSACGRFHAIVPAPRERRRRYRFRHNWSSRVHSAALVAALRVRLAAQAHDAVFLDHLRLAYLLPLVRDAAPGVPVAAIHHNIEHDNFREELRAEPSRTRRLVLLVKNARLRATEHAFLSGSDVSFFISDEDRLAGLALSSRDEARARVLPAYFPFERTKPEAQLRRDCACFLLLGSLAWLPNYHGVSWFVKVALPTLRTKIPGCRVLVVGNTGNRSLAPLRAEGVEIRGFVDDVEPVFREADLLVVPNELGGGAKMKVLEALGRGVPVVAHARSTRGLPPELFAEGFAADTREQLVQRVLTVAANAEARVRFVRRGLQCLAQRADLAPAVVAGLGF